VKRRAGAKGEEEEVHWQGAKEVQQFPEGGASRRISLRPASLGTGTGWGAAVTGGGCSIGSVAGGGGSVCLLGNVQDEYVMARKCAR